MKLFSNPLVIGAIVIGGGYLLLKSGVFDSVLAQDIKSWATPEQIARWKNNPNARLRPGIRESLYGGY